MAQGKGISEGCTETKVAFERDGAHVQMISVSTVHSGDDKPWRFYTQLGMTNTGQNSLSQDFLRHIL